MDNGQLTINHAAPQLSIMSASIEYEDLQSGNELPLSKKIGIIGAD